jgi:hypothetical protein
LRDYFVDQHQTLWVSNRWIALHYGMATKFNEQALEIDFTGKIKAPVKEWSDYHARWNKDNTLDSLVPWQGSKDIYQPHAEMKSFEISTWSGRYEIIFQSDKVNADVRWDAIGHAGKVGFRAFGTANLEWPGLELEWAWGSQQQINLFITPAYQPNLWKIRGGNSLMNRTISFEAPKGLYRRQWTPPRAISEWSLNHGPFHYHPNSTKSASSILGKDHQMESTKHISIALLPGSNQIDYRYQNAWGGISSQQLLWNIPGLMIPHRQWNYGYEISAIRRVSGTVGYGLSPWLGLQTEAAVQDAKDTRKNLEWDLRGSALWTAGRIMYGQSQYSTGPNIQKWEQSLHLNFSQSLQGSLLYQKCRYAIHNKPNEEDGKLSGLWILPQGYGLKMLRFELPFKKVDKALLYPKEYQAILQFEGWRQQWLWQIPEHRLSWQGRLQFKAPALTLVYQAIAHQEGWQAFVQGHLRGGHHLGFSYILPKQNNSNTVSNNQTKAGNWTVEWKWMGLQSSRSARAILNAESSRWEYHGQFTLSRKNNSAPISATNGLALILLELFGDQNANGTKDPGEVNLDAAGAFDLPAGIPYQILINGSAMIGPFPNNCRVHIRLNPQHMRSPGWISDHSTMELQSSPNSTLVYRIGLIRGRQIYGTVTLAKTPSPNLPIPLPNKQGAIRIHAHRVDEEHSPKPCPINHKSGFLSNSCLQTLTLSDGYFEFNDLKPGLYKIWVDWPPLYRLGFSGDCPMQVLDLRQDETAEVNLSPP